MSLKKFIRFIKPAIIVVLLIIIGSYANFEFSKEEKPLLKESFSKTPKEEYVLVALDGQVKTPGVYIIEKGKTIYDAIYKSGGITPYADLTDVNLDTPLFEDCNITIGTKAIEEDIYKKININTATIDELDTLDGIGVKTAEKIINYRETKSPFKTIDELKNIEGIADKLFDKIKDRICV